MILWKSNRRSRKQNTNSAYDSAAYNKVKTALSESQAEAEQSTNDNRAFKRPGDNVRLRALRLAGSSNSASDSDNLVFTGS